MRINGQNVCIGCMKPLGLESGCSFCGMKQDDYNPIPRCLLPGTKLADRYILGRVLGEGSFGITYIGWDQHMEIPVAVKEYFPSEMVSRDVICGKGNHVYLYENSRKGRYEDDLQKFLNEARCLSRFNDVKGIVSVLDFFYENNTAYIVMQYIDGVSVKQYVDENGKIPAERVIESMEPVLLALEQVHQTGIVHRDISPDNIMIRKDGSLVLIDFGAARMRNMDHTKTMTVMFKRGFSPEEQYRYKGKWGAYTDVYSISATMYFMMTGTPPTDSVIRALGDELPSLVSMKELKLPVKQKKAVMKGMEVSAKNRWQSVGQMYAALYDEDHFPALSCGWKTKKTFVICLFLAAAAILLFGASRLLGSGGESAADSTWKAAGKDRWRTPDIEEQTKVKMSQVTGLRKEEADAELEQYADVLEVRWKKEYSDVVEEGRVISQSIPAGEELRKEEKRKLTLVVSRGKEKVTVPGLSGLTVKEAKKILKKRKLRWKIRKVESTQESGVVLVQSISKGKKAAKGKTITLTVSQRRTVATPKPSSGQQGDSSREKSRTDKEDFAGVIQ